jgi:kinesin family protein 2/24
LEDSFGETRLVGATEPRVMRPTDLIKLINKAVEFRKTSQTAKNDFSSRSHAICKITITDNRTPSAPDGVLYLVDLAGSEIAADVASHGAEQMRETREINKSLSVLKDCIRGRAQLGNLEDGASKREYIPFRHSVLTKVLKHVFDPAAGRDCKTAVVACINPSYLDVVASKNTLRYAEMLRVPIARRPSPPYNENDPKTWSNEHVKAWIAANVRVRQKLGDLHF